MGCEFNANKKDMRENCEWCYTSTETCIHSRRCFVTGEYCSKQTNIQRERKKLYEDNSITAFVIMNFSEMTSVVYKWRLRSFIESLSKYLYIDKKNKRLYCSAVEREEKIETLTRVREIRVVRSDSDPASNYVICSRICQQMQIADLIIVDVSSQNANVFYEFGMAVALGKLILPICYSESFYKMDKELAANSEKEHHIGCYPWRKRLFEYYGIRYRKSQNTSTKYDEFKEVTNAKYKFPDRKYDCFPYHEVLKGDGKRIGEVLYNRLAEEYNGADEQDNTLIVYTMDGFLNEGQAGLCIVNFYKSITARMRKEQCFCGERVGVLVQEKAIPESEKDAGSQLDLFYSVGEIIHIGLNQATYLAAEKRIKTKDVLKEPQLLESEHLDNPIKGNPTKEQTNGIKRFIKGHIKNRGMLIYPNYPVYVNRMKNGLQENLLDDSKPESKEGCDCCKEDAFCLYHVMLKTLRYTNEIVVDITDNCLQSLFWLGAAHGSDIYAITVLHEETDEERKITSGTEEKNSRNVFDVAGLWTAILHSYDTEGFYKQLELAQQGIEHHSKLILDNSKFYEKSVREYLFSFEGESSEAEIEKLLRKRENEEALALESYYRKHFWNPMLRYNRLRIYLLHQNDIADDLEPRIHTAKWDFDAVAALSHYLSKRTVIGEYLIKSLSDGERDEEADQTNFICVGASVKPLERDMPSYIYSQIHEVTAEAKKRYGDAFNVIHRRNQYDERSLGFCKVGKKVYKGFERIGEEENVLYTQHPQSQCVTCYLRQNRKDRDASQQDGWRYVFREVSEMSTDCRLNKDGTHIEIAQLILWREEPDSLHERSYFRVAMSGSSGPATYALSALLVDEKQKQEFFSVEKEIEEESDKDQGNHLLCDLQETVRRKFMEVFLIKLQEGLDTIDIKLQDGKALDDTNQKNRYFSLVKYAASYYLSTVLYRYFLPFLSETDINRIYNGMYIYIHSMKATKTSPFALDYPRRGDSEYETAVSNDTIDEIVELIPKVLLSVLKLFRGLEAFYEVEVRQRSEGKPASGKDTRIVQGIEMMRKEGNAPEVNCFFCFDE